LEPLHFFINLRQKLKMLKKFLPYVCLLILIVIYGSAYAIVAQGLKYFTPNLMISYRMTFAFIFCALVMVFKFIFKKGYVKLIRKNCKYHIMDFFYLILAGLFIHGGSQIFIANAQKYISSAGVQVCMPLSMVAGSIVCHFTIQDERCNVRTFVVVILSLIGVALTALPTFSSDSNPYSTKQTVIGYCLLVTGISMQGISPVIVKLKVPKMDLAFQGTIQTFASAVVCFTFTLFYDGYKVIVQQTRACPLKGWVWPVLVGVLATGFTSMLIIYVTNELGANGANTMSFGQIVVGVLVGVFLLNEWKAYKLWEVYVSIFGMILLTASLLIQLLKKKGKSGFIKGELSEVTPSIMDNLL
jgi:drug/metabolite transporter (DMT)-like permease